MKELTTFRRELHRYPELSGNEYNTAERIKRFLESTNPSEVIEGIGGAGVAVIYDSGKEGSVVGIRADLDALPIDEDNTFDHRSKNPGVSHKCGHDGHMAIVAGLGKMLQREPIKKGKVLLLFQPSEETGEGALRVLSDPGLKRMAPDYLFGLHNLPGEAEGRVLSRPGIFASASIGMIVTLKGRTSHAAEPENGHSPAIPMADTVKMLENLVTDTRDHLEDFSLITVIHARLGEKAFGTTPGYAEVMCTLRSYQNNDLETLKQHAAQKAAAIAAKHEIKAGIEWTEAFSATDNRPECFRIIQQAAKNKQIEFKELESPYRWSEDFGYFLQKYKGAMFALGAGKDTPDLHNSDYDFPDQLIPHGIDIFREIINLALENNPCRES